MTLIAGFSLTQVLKETQRLERHEPAMTFLRRISAAALLLTVLFHCAHSQDSSPEATFLYPDKEGLIIYNNQKIIVKYKSNVEYLDVRLYCNNPDEDEIEEGKVSSQPLPLFPRPWFALLSQDVKAMKKLTISDCSDRRHSGLVYRTDRNKKRLR